MRTWKAHRTKNRFFITDETGHWQVVDEKDTTCFDCTSKREAQLFATFCRAYVKRHGDIDLNSVPWDLKSALHYDSATKPEYRLVDNGEAYGD